MSSKVIGIEEARKQLGDLVTAVQQGADITITRNGKPAARLVRYQPEDTMTTITSYTETYHPNTNGLADLALPVDLEAHLRDAIDEPGSDLADRIGDAITAQIREHGVNTETGEWLGQWSAEDIVRRVLARRDA